MTKKKNMIDARMEVHDYDLKGSRILFGKSYFYSSIRHLSSFPPTTMGFMFRSGLPSIPGTSISLGHKATSRMNVAIRGTDGKFISYRKLNTGKTKVIFDAIEALPTV